MCTTRPGMDKMVETHLALKPIPNPNTDFLEKFSEYSYMRVACLLSCLLACLTLACVLALPSLACLPYLACSRRWFHYRFVHSNTPHGGAPREFVLPRALLRRSIGSPSSFFCSSVYYCVWPSFVKMVDSPHIHSENLPRKFPGGRG